MLNFLNNRTPNLREYESLPGHLRYEFSQNCGNYYTKDQGKLKSLDEELKQPELFRYWKNSLN